jgi:hypothetical protein
MRGRFVVAALALVALVVGVVVAEPVGAAPAVPAVAAQAGGSYTNPVLAGQTVSPSVLKSGSTYYAYVSGVGAYGVPMLVYRSTNLTNWSQVGNALSLTDVGAWAQNSNASQISSPSVREIATNPPASRFIAYYTGIARSSGDKCIGLATSSSPTGPFVGAPTPLVCPTGGAQDPSALVMPEGWPIQQLLYRKNGTNPGIYNQVLNADGLTLHASAPKLLYTANPTWWHNGIVDRPTIASAAGQDVLIFSGGAPNTGSRALGWSPCTNWAGIIMECQSQTRFGTWVAGNAQVASPSSPQVFSDGTNLWLAYDAVPGGTCTGAGGTCTGLRSGRIDKLCIGHGEPRTTAPSTTGNTTRNASCSLDVPGAPVGSLAVTDNAVVRQPSTVFYRDGGATAAVGGRIVWGFSDTLAAQGSGCPNPSNGAGWGVPAAGATGPNWVQGPPAPGCVPQAIPLTAEEQAWTTAHACGWVPTAGCGRWLIWENGVMPAADGSARWFFLKMKETWQPRTCNAGETPPCLGVTYTDRHTGIAHMAVGALTATRSATLGCTPTCLFDYPDGPTFEIYAKPLVVDGHVYLYSDFKVARAPLADVENPAAWAWYDTGHPQGWNPDRAAGDEMTGIRGDPLADPLDLGVGQVAYNPYLDAFVNVAPDHAWARHAMVIQTAPNPWGPWSPEQAVMAATPLCSGSDAAQPYGFLQAPPLAMENGRTIVFTYARPPGGIAPKPTCPGPGELRFATLRFG